MTDEAAAEVDAVREAGPAREEDAEQGTHLEEVPSGAGCTEIWEKLSEQREATGDGE